MASQPATRSVVAVRKMWRPGLAKTGQDRLCADWETVTTQVLDGGPLCRLLKGRGFVFRRPSFLVERILLDDEVSPDIFSNSERWLLTGADFDVL